MIANREIGWLVLLLSIMVRTLPAAPAIPLGGGVITATQEKKNCSAGVDVAAGSVAELFSRIGFRPDQPGNFYFIVLTDTHVYAADEHQEAGNHPVFSHDTAGSLRRLIDEANAMSPQPAFAVVTGDLVHDAKVAQFKRFKEIMGALNPAISVHLCLGNHDANRENFKAVFPDRKPYYTFQHGVWKVVILDSGKEGALDPPQAEWLRTDIGASVRDPVLVFLHYPLIPYYPKDDVLALHDAVMSSLATNRNERWVFSGHWHSNFLVQLGLGEQGTVRQVVTTASTSSFGYDIPGYRLVCVEGRRVFSTIFHRVGDAIYRIDPPPHEWPVYEPDLSKNSLLHAVKKL